MLEPDQSYGATGPIGDSGLEGASMPELFTLVR